MFDALPDELVELIVDYCSIDDLKALRSTNRHTNRISTPFAFQCYHMGLFVSSLEKLLEFARSPLARHVKRFVFHSDLLPYWRAQNWWEGYIDLRPSFSEWQSRQYGESDDYDRSRASELYREMPTHSYTDSELSDHYLQCCRLLEEQIAWDERHHGLILKECFSSLPNLREATVEKAKPFGGRLNYSPYWKKIVNKTLVGPDDWIYVLSEALMPDCRQHDRECLGALSLLEAIGYRAGFSGIRPIDKITLDMTFHQSLGDTIRQKWRCGKVCDIEYDRRYNSIKEAFAQVHELELLCPYAPDELEPGRFGPAEEIHDILRSSREVRCLDLSYGDGEKKEYDDYRRQFGLSPIFESKEVIWTHLTDLKLTASVPAAAFIGFLALHAGTLKTLEMRDNVSDDWRHILETIPKILQLEYIYLECLWQWEDGEDESEDGQYVCFFDQGTDEDNAYNKDLKSFLLHGEGRPPL